MRLSQKITRWSSSRKIETYAKNRNYQVVITTHFFKQFYFVILYFSGAGRGTFSLCHSLFRNRSELNVLLSTSSFCIKSRPFFCKVITQKKSARSAENVSKYYSCVELKIKPNSISHFEHANLLQIVYPMFIS